MMVGMVQDGTMAHRATETAADANGNVFYDQYGLPADMTALVQAHTGERLLNLDGPFQTGHGRMERLLPQRVSRFGDPDDRAAEPGQEMTGCGQAYVQGLAQTLGLASRTAGQAREQGVQRLAQAGKAGRSRFLSDADIAPWALPG